MVSLLEVVGEKRSIVVNSPSAGEAAIAATLPGVCHGPAHPMNWFKVVIGFVIMIGVLVGWYRLMRHLKGDGGGGMKLDVARKDGGKVNELEQFIAARRAGVPDAVVAEPPVPAEAPVPPPAPLPAVGTTVAAAPAEMPAASVAASAPATAASSSMSVPGAASAQGGAPLLTGSHKLAFLLFKTALPEYLVFPRVALTDVAPAAAARGMPHVFALVVCRADLVVVAAVDFADGGGHNPTVPRALSEAGVRHLLVDPRALPRRDALRVLVEGG